ncbi:SDR family oxidoreductase [Paraburkholderia sp. D15]|uniref:SDR family oxidoreductase n=1 Tax=Paraburkholderia sp. D15 TaxID=2880218 RepID=UPI00247ACB1E|nr:SDR family oxidoreductase [Paraburkholderia sp. D15]WGS49687.1 SDR family oxidoreductase [Paraburkholderia sp. D15]
MFAWHTPLSNAWQDSLVAPVRGEAPGVDRVLLTGATGFIGGNLLVTLINAGLLDRLVCLVRGASVADALARLRVSAVRCGLPHSRALRIGESNVMVGELGGELPEADEARLAEISHVINCAAQASLPTQPDMADTNVRDTLRFASRFSGSRSLRRFLHVSTAMACGTQCGANVQESPFGYGESQHIVPYTRSKREVERLLRVTYPRLPLVVVRPSIVVGHTVLGTLPSASLFWVFRVVHGARRFTARAMNRLDVVSADDCARAIALLAVKPTLAFDTYHVSAGTEAPTIGQIIGAMDEATGTSGRRYSMCRVRDFGAIARDVVGRDRSGSGRLIEHALRRYAGFAELDYAFDNRRLRKEIGFEPLPFTDYLSECVRTSRGVGIVEQMRWDFK